MARFVGNFRFKLVDEFTILISWILIKNVTIINTKYGKSKRSICMFISYPNSEGITLKKTVLLRLYKF